MAKCTIKLGEQFMRELTQMAGNIDRAIPHALEAGGKVVYGIMKGNLDRAVGKGTKYPSRSTGKLQGSLGVSPVKLDDSGNYDVKVGFAEGRGKVSNAMLANLLEYGKHGQPGRPFLAPTKSRAKQPCISAMEETLKKELLP